MKNRQLVAATRATQDQSESLARDISIVAQLNQIINARTATTPTGITEQK